MDMISHGSIKSIIYEVRGRKAMLDSDLAKLYGVSTKKLLQGVKRNKKRFPSDFMYQLTDKEVINLRSQIVTSSWGGRRYLPYVFTEHGVAMLSSILNSERAIQVNILIVRTFVELREIALSYKDLWVEIEKMEKKYDQQFQMVFKAIKLLLEKPKEGPPNRLS
jgi:hypothetical protein